MVWRRLGIWVPGAPPQPFSTPVYPRAHPSPPPPPPPLWLQVLTDRHGEKALFSRDHIVRCMARAIPFDLHQTVKARARG